ncbi:MAG: SCP2 sterol-binding domain-containing protein [Pseudomonadales bacterium]|jgi:putative sterol carrier protein|nr:SCP2 sterol-binding domain-containing protein [Pseudomonadales bacterium]
MSQPADPGVEEIRTRLAGAFRPEAAAGLEAVYQFEVAGRPLFHLEIDGGRLRVEGGAHEAPTVTFLFDDVATALGVVEGSLDPMATFMAGRVRTDGHLILALQLGGLFAPARSARG